MPVRSPRWFRYSAGALLSFLLIASSGAQPSDVLGWQDLRWGMAIEAVRATLALRESAAPESGDGPDWGAFTLTTKIGLIEYEIVLSFEKGTRGLVGALGRSRAWRTRGWGKTLGLACRASPCRGPRRCLDRQGGGPGREGRGGTD